MKRVILSIMLIITVLFTASCRKNTTKKITMTTTKKTTKDYADLSNYYKTRYESATDEELIDYLELEPKNLINKYNNLDDEIYGRVIASSKSKEDAIMVCTSHFSNNDNTVTECTVIYESDLLYGLKVKWHHNNSQIYQENVISFKDSVISMKDLSASDTEEFYKIYTDDFNTIETILIYIACNKTGFFGVDQCCFLDYETSSLDDKYIIEVYFSEYHRGDFKKNSKYVINKMIVEIDKEDGKATTSNFIRLREIEVEKRK